MVSLNCTLYLLFRRGSGCRSRYGSPRRHTLRIQKDLTRSARAAWMFGGGAVVVGLPSLSLT
eukprot:2779973-Prymnesium_polylepis.1